MESRSTINREDTNRSQLQRFYKTVEYYINKARKVQFTVTGEKAVDFSFSSHNAG